MPIRLNWLGKQAVWVVANGKTSVLLFTSWQIIKSYTSVKLTRSNLFRLSFMEKGD